MVLSLKVNLYQIDLKGEYLTEMSFKVRALYKPNRVNTEEEVDFKELIRRNQELEDLKNNVKKNGQRSSQEKLLNSNDLMNILRSSSVNPDVNPAVREKIEELLKMKETIPEDEEEKEVTIEEKKERKFDPKSDISMNYPSRASMIRGYKRTHSSGNGSIKRTAHGIVDAF